MPKHMLFGEIEKYITDVTTFSGNRKDWVRFTEGMTRFRIKRVGWTKTVEKRGLNDGTRVRRRGQKRS